MREEIAIWTHTQDRILLRILFEASPENVSWENLTEEQRDYFRKKADQILTLITERIKKSLLTDEEIVKVLWPLFSGASNRVPPEITLTADDIGIANRRVAQAQLDKVLKEIDERIND